MWGKLGQKGAPIPNHPPPPLIIKRLSNILATYNSKIGVIPVLQPTLEMNNLITNMSKFAFLLSL